MYGFVSDKEYLIDPDGINNGEEPFVVNCNMEKGKFWFFASHYVKSSSKVFPSLAVETWKAFALFPEWLCLLGNISSLVSW